MVCAKEESVCGEDVGRTAEGEERDGRGKGGESGRDESRQRIGFGLFAPWPATLHTVARHEAVQARINRFPRLSFFYIHHQSYFQALAAHHYLVRSLLRFTERIAQSRVVEIEERYSRITICN